jgi:hypothetical protein
MEDVSQIGLLGGFVGRMDVTVSSLVESGTHRLGRSCAIALNSPFTLPIHW